MNGKTNLTITPTMGTINVGDSLTMEVTVPRPWWAFWRKSRKSIREFVVTSVQRGSQS